MKTIDISGSWRFRTDEQADYSFDGETFPKSSFILPGSTCENHIGRKQEYYERISKEAVRAPRERYEYIAPIWLQREIELPEDIEGKSVTLFLERVNIASDLWIDNVKIDRQVIELSAPHIYNLTGRISAGVHIITLRIDNRNLLNLDVMASGYSVDTQGYWNGVIGRMEIQYEDMCHIDSISVYPDMNGIDIKMVNAASLYSPWERKNITVEMEVTAPDGSALGISSFDVKLYNSKQVDHFRYDIPNVRCWDEFDAALYVLEAKYICGGEVLDTKTVRFGMRTIAVRNHDILLNDREISLRGTVNCAIYPITGYPPMDKSSWMRDLEIIKSYGLNHVRFHAWCPPECAFDAADELGLYLSVEMPLWLNRDACGLETGEDPIHRQYFLQEAMTISKTYGNHPSFIMFSNGNENMGDFDLLNDITTCVKAYDNRRLYTVTTNFDHPLLPCEDYLCASDAAGQMIRIQGYHDEVAESTCLDFSQAVADVDAPIISFEVGQYCVYPDVDLIESYTGNMLPVNLDVIRKHMREKSVYDRLQDYIAASGELSAKLYKEDIEAALRTKHFGGFELLALSDYTGQSTATIGMLDAFYNSKGIITPEKFREFCGSVVPLFKARRIFRNDEMLEAELDVYDFGAERMTAPEYNLKLFLCDGTKISENQDDVQKPFYECTTRESRVGIPLDRITKSAQLEVTLEVNGHRNSWKVFVFVPVQEYKNVRFIHSKEELENIAANGGRAVVTKECFENPIPGSFIPVFWSPVHFPTKKPCGAIIDSEHPVFNDFPTEKYPDYQWKRLLDNSVGMDITELGEECQMIIETVPNFFDNTKSSPLFEMKRGNAELLFCGFDLDMDCPESRQLKKSICEYIASSNRN